jgi:thiol-disulfide isomerase/thioredoxin
MTRSLTNAFSRLQWIALMPVNHESKNLLIKPRGFRRALGLLFIAGLLSSSFVGCADTSQPIAGNQADTDKQAVPKVQERLMVIHQSIEGDRELSPQPLTCDIVMESDDAVSFDDADRKSAAKDISSTDAFDSRTSLHLGDKAPELNVKQWIRRIEPSGSQKPDKLPIQVITFWATWCEPSIAALTKIPFSQSRFSDDIDWVAVSSESPEAITGFLNQPKSGSEKSWSDVLSISIASDQHGEAESTFLLAGSEQGLPTSIVIDRDGVIAWTGPTDRLEPVLSKIVAGNWDIQQARQSHQRSLERTMAQRSVRDQLALAKVSNDVDRCLELIDELLAKFPGDDEFELLRLQYLLNGQRVEDANALASSLLSDLADDSQRQNQLSWMLSESAFLPNLNVDIAVSAAERAVDLTGHSDVSSLETLARAHFRSGDVDAAVATQSKAIQLAPDNSRLQQTLTVFQQAASDKVEKASFKDSQEGNG